MYKVFEMKETQIITIQEAAKILNVNPETLRRWDRKGKFKAKRHPINGYRLYNSKDIHTLLKNNIKNNVTIYYNLYCLLYNSKNFVS